MLLLLTWFYFHVYTWHNLFLACGSRLQHVWGICWLINAAFATNNRSLDGVISKEHGRMLLRAGTSYFLGTSEIHRQNLSIAPPCVPVSSHLITVLVLWYDAERICRDGWKRLSFLRGADGHVISGNPDGLRPCSPALQSDASVCRPILQ